MKEIGTTLLRFAVVAASGMLIMRLAGPKLAVRMGRRMRRMIEEAPDDYPPKWWYLNLVAIRENTERILAALGEEPSKLP